MFESILERVLNGYLGRFVEGLDANHLHLGVWKGDVRVENLSLRPDFMDSFEFPVKIMYSSVGTLIMKVPWTKLWSMPVSITLEDILILVEPTEEASWNFHDEKALKRKLTMIREYIVMCIEKSLMKLEVTESAAAAVTQTSSKDTSTIQKESYIAKLTKRIIDNLELTIKRVHFRYEDPKNKYSWGKQANALSAANRNSLLHLRRLAVGNLRLRMQRSMGKIVGGNPHIHVKSYVVLGKDSAVGSSRSNRDS